MFTGRRQLLHFGLCLCLFIPFITIKSPQFSQQLCAAFPQVSFQIQPARVYLEDTFVYYIKTLFHTYIPDSAMAPSTAGTQRGREPGSALLLPEQVSYSRLVSLKLLFRLDVVSPLSLTLLTCS